MTHNELAQWMKKQFKLEKEINRSTITKMFACYASELGLSDFKASGKWFSRFKKRHGINQQVLHGEAGSADMVYVHIAQAGLPKLLENVSPYDIYNMDETGLNYCTLPKRTLGTEQRKGYVAAKDSLTLCVNMTGTHKLNPMIIGFRGRWMQ